MLTYYVLDDNNVNDEIKTKRIYYYRKVSFKTGDIEQATSMYIRLALCQVFY